MPFYLVLEYAGKKDLNKWWTQQSEVQAGQMLTDCDKLSNYPSVKIETHPGDVPGPKHGKQILQVEQRMLEACNQLGTWLPS